MDEVRADRIPTRIVLNGSSSLSLSERFRQLKRAARAEPSNMSGLHEPRSFLYDDYMDQDLNARTSDLGIGGGSMLHGGRSRDINVNLDGFARVRHPTQGALRRRPALDDDFGLPRTGGAHASRFADAMGIPSSTRAQRVYDDIEYAPAPRRAAYRDLPPPRPRQIVRRVIDDGRGYLDDSRDGEIIEVIERVRRPARNRVEVVRKVPIHQRVVKKVIVQKVTRPANKRRNDENQNRRVPRVQNRKNTGGIQKNKAPGGEGRIAQRGAAGGGGPKKDKKPKMTASELDRELDEYMRGSKHPRI